MDLARQTVGALVAEDYRRASVFERYGIDFCCGGGKTLQAACMEQQASLEAVAHDLKASDQREAAAAGTALRPATWTAAFLADYIANVHHTYVRESLPSLRAFTQKVARVHGDGHPETVEVARLVEDLATELLRHLKDEEEELFPYARALTAASEADGELGHAASSAVREAIRTMEADHDHAGAVMREVRRLSDDYTPPADACATYRAAYAKLEEFEADLHLHVHLENNLLFPKVAALRRQSASRARRSRTTAAT